MGKSGSGGDWETRREKAAPSPLQGADSSGHVSVDHTIQAHNSFRNPLISKGGTHVVVGNVIYDWDAIPAEVYDEDSSSCLNFTGNFFRAGSVRGRAWHV